MYKRFVSFIFFIVLFVSCSNESGSVIEVFFISYFSSAETTAFEEDARGGKDKNVYKLSANEYSINHLTFEFSDTDPCDFYVISVSVKTEDIVFQKNEAGRGIVIMSDDESDFNRDKVYSNGIIVDTVKADGNKSGWVNIKHVVKSDKNGRLKFIIGNVKNECKGTIYLKDIKVTPAKDDNDYTILQSDDGKVRMVFYSEDLQSGQSDLDIYKRWINLYADFRKSLKELIGDTEPYEGKTDYICVNNIDFYGIAGNPIYMDRERIKEDIKYIELDEMSEKNDILWGFLHEMSHTFDGVPSDAKEQSWVFDEEFLATFKCLYSFYENGYGFGGDLHTGKNAGRHFDNALSLSSGIYSGEGLTRLLLSYMNGAEDNGWQAVNKTFMQLNKERADNNITKESKKDIFNSFMDILSDNLGIDIMGNIDQEEKDTLNRHFNE